MSAVHRIGTNEFSTEKKCFVSFDIFSAERFLQLVLMKKQSVFIATAFVNFPNEIVVFYVGNASNVEQSMCHLCFKESFENKFWLQPSTIKVVACCRIATIARTICSNSTNVFWWKNPMKLWYLFGIRPHSHCQMFSAITRTNSPKQCFFLDVGKCVPIFDACSSVVFSEIMTFKNCTCKELELKPTSCHMMNRSSQNV